LIDGGVFMLRWRAALSPLKRRSISFVRLIQRRRVILQRLRQ
jgi:hypothetical protein